MRSFQTIQETLEVLWDVFCHQSIRQEISAGANYCNPTLDSNMCQTSRVKMQEANRWSVVSSC